MLFADTVPQSFSLALLSEPRFISCILQISAYLYNLIHPLHPLIQSSDMNRTLTRAGNGLRVHYKPDKLNH